MWSNAPPQRLETHYGDRVVRCYVDRPHSVDELLALAAAHCPNAIAVVDGDRRLTYAELNARAGAVAGGLLARAVQPGDRVGLLLDNRREFVEAFFGVLRAGAIAMPLNIRDQKPELQHLLGHAEVKVLIHEGHLSDRVPDAAALPSLLHRISVGVPVPGSEPFEELANFNPSPVASVGAESPAVILYTSGTTGKPKGAILTHLSIITSTLNYETCWELTRDDKAVMAVPISHVTGLVAILLTMVRVRGTTILMREFKASRFLEMAAAEQMTYTILVPTMYNLCLLQTSFDSFDLSKWRVGGYGGAPMPSATIAVLSEKMPDLYLVNAYGATETTSPSTLMPLGQGVHHADTVGKPVPTAEVVIMDPEGHEVPVGASGEVWIRGGHVVVGYWADDAATKSSFQAGFWASGDIGAMTESGYLKLLDRKKDLINRGGYKVYSAEVESVLMQHSSVAEAAVVAVPDPVLGERSHAIIFPRREPPSTSVLKQFCVERLSDYKVPDFITFIDHPLPRNSAGKVLKRQLSEIKVAEIVGDGSKHTAKLS